jgi:hypothetical protein
MLGNTPLTVAPVVTVAVATVLFVVVAIWRFREVEL